MNFRVDAGTLLPQNMSGNNDGRARVAAAGLKKKGLRRRGGGRKRETTTFKNSHSMDQL